MTLQKLKTDKEQLHGSQRNITNLGSDKKLKALMLRRKMNSIMNHSHLPQVQPGMHSNAGSSLFK